MGGFGHNPFGGAPFGHSNYSEEAVWERSIPVQNREDDRELVGDGDRGDLERFLVDVAGGHLKWLRELIHDFPDQRFALEARSGQEEAEELAVQSTDRLDRNRVEISVQPQPDDEYKKILERMAPRSETAEGEPRIDGWEAEVNGTLYPITRVDAENMVVEVETPVSITASMLEVRPADMLTRLGGNKGILVDRQDPPDYTRRALYREPLIRDLKVSGRMFSLIGEIYGFDITVAGLNCISESKYNELKLNKPSHAFKTEHPEGSGTIRYFTDLPSEVRQQYFQYDQVPADVVGADQSTPETFSVTVNNVTNPKGNTYCLELDPSDEDDVENILKPNPWKITDSNGSEHQIESADPNTSTGDPPEVCVISDGAPPSGSATLTVYPVIKTSDACPASAYVFFIRFDQILQEPGASTVRLVDRIEEKIDRYIPLHIRSNFKVFQFETTVEFAEDVFGDIDTTMNIQIQQDDQAMTAQLFKGDRYDDQAADVEPADQDVFMIYTDMTITT